VTFLLWVRCLYRIYLACATATLRQKALSRHHNRSSVRRSLKQTQWSLVRKWTIPAERPPLVEGVGRGVSLGQRSRSPLPLISVFWTGAATSSFKQLLKQLNTRCLAKIPCHTITANPCSISISNTRNTVPGETLSVAQLVTKGPRLLWNPRVHYRIQTNPPTDPNRVHSKPQTSNLNFFHIVYIIKWNAVCGKLNLFRRKRKI
jgi:hypothetical protein